MRPRSLVALGGLVLAVLTLAATVYLAKFSDFSFPNAPSLDRTLTPLSKPAPLEIGSYDILGKTVGRDEAARLLASKDGKRQLAPENGAVAITQDLVNLGRRAFYEETYSNEIFLTQVVGILDGPVNPWTLMRATLSLGGEATTNLQIPIDREITVGGHRFREGTWINTGLDVPKGSLTPLGMRIFVKRGRLQVGMTCAACHATVDPRTGLILEGAPNSDLNAGLLLAFASNSAAFFRQTSVNPLQFPPGLNSYENADGKKVSLPDPEALEDAVDAALLAWPPGNFDSTGDLVNNPSQIPTAYTFDAWPYGWSGFAAIGWFHGLTTLNANVHGTNSDLSTGADSSPLLLGIPKDVYVGVLLQRAADPRFRPPGDEPPGKFLERMDPTPGAPALNRAITMPGYPLGSPFILDGLMPATPGLPVAAQLNGMSAFQNTLAPPPYRSEDPNAVRHGAQVFKRAGCAGCHSGSRFTNHRVVSQSQIGSQPSRARALAAFLRVFGPPRTYPADVPVPLPLNPRIIRVPEDISPAEDRQRAYAQNDPAGGLKVPSLIGLQVSAPYLHDGGVAAGPEALRRNGNRFIIARARQLGPAGTVFVGLPTDPVNSLRLLLDRQLRAALVKTNRTDTRLQQANVDGSGHEFWVDIEGGFSGQDQDDVIAFLLSLDDDPALIP